MPLREIGAYVAAETGRPLDGTVAHHARRAVIDWFAAMYPGALFAPNPQLRAALAEELGHGRATVFPKGERAPARTAAFLNGASAHASEFDDIFRDASYHPGCATIPAALAAVETRGADGAAFLRGVVAGYEVSTRIGLSLGRSHYARWHTTATVATFGAAAAAASVLRLTGDQTAHALANAATMAAGLQQAFRSDGMSKPIHSGHAAEAGLLSALAAEQGVTGALDVLDGEVGMGVVMSDGADWSRATAGLGRDYNITKMTFKNHGCCGHTFAAIDGALALKAEHGLRAEEVERVEVGTYSPAKAITDRPDPRTPVDCRFSTQWVVSHALVHGSVRLAAFEPERIADPAVRTLLPRVTVAVDPELDARFPAQRAARVAILATDGRRLERLQPTRKGDPDQPLTDDEVSDKFRELAAAALPAASVETLLAALWALGTRPGLELPGATA